MYYIVIENLSLLATVVLLVDAKLGKKAVVVVCPMFFCCPTACFADKYKYHSFVRFLYIIYKAMAELFTPYII